MYGALGRLYSPQLLITGQTDAVVLLLPGAAIGGGELDGWPGVLLAQPAA